MLSRIGHLQGSRVVATDGDIGHVKDIYFDDLDWTIRYLVIDTGTWLPGRDVLVSPHAVQQPLTRGNVVDLVLTRQQVQDSPVVDTHRPVSRQHERDYLGHYGFPEYWIGGQLWGSSALPLMPLPQPSTVESEAESAMWQQEVPPEDVHLRCSSVVSRYDIQAVDGSIGHVEDFLFDDETWAIGYLVVDTRNWWPGGRKVTLATRWIDRIDWADRTVFIRLDRASILASPDYQEGVPVDRADAQRPGKERQQRGYWRLGGPGRGASHASTASTDRRNDRGTSGP